MSKVIITVGIPASGKTTWAKQYVKSNPNTVITCRDDIRRSHGITEYGVPAVEQRLTKIQRGQIEFALLDGFDVIVADTNINKAFRKNLIKFAHKHGADVVIMPFPISLDEAILRDAARSDSVGADVVSKFYAQLQKQDISSEPEEFPVRTFGPYEHRVSRHCGGFGSDPKIYREAVCVDIDGTVARHTARSPYDYDRVSEDEPIDDIVSLVETLSEEYIIIFVSGRDGSCANDTKKWIKDNLMLDDFELFMRSPGDERPDWEIKNEIYDESIIPNYNVIAVLDDRDQVVRHLRNRGLTVLQVAPGRF